MNLREIKKYFAVYSIEYVGICKFADVLPLLECRSKNRIPENSQTVILCLFPYYVGGYEERNISRYALGSDYHKVAGDILKSVTENLRRDYLKYHFEAFIDSSPIREVNAAVLAGLGSVGLNNQLINEKYGTYTFIGEIITDAVFLEENLKIKKNLCLNCKKCLNACPTKALSENGFRKEICRSFITQKKKELTDWETAQIEDGKMVWGCDICNDACPYNKNPILSPIKEMYENIHEKITEENVSKITGKAYEYRGEKVIKRNIGIIEKKNQKGVIQWKF